MENVAIFKYLSTFILVALIFLLYRKSKEIERLESAKDELSNIQKDMGLYCQRISDDLSLTLQPSDGLLSLTVYTPEDILLKFNNQFAELIHTNDRPKVLSAFIEAKSTNQNIEINFRLRHRKLNIIWIKSIISYSLQEKFFYCLMEDITSYVESNQRLKQAEADIETITNNISGGVATFKFDDDLTILYANDRYYKTIGYSQDEVSAIYKNKSIYFIAPDTIEQQRYVIKEQIKENKQLTFEMKICKKDGSYLWLRATGHLKYNANNEAIFPCVLMDITNLKKAENQWQLENERYRVATELTNDTVFDYNIITDTLVHTKQDNNAYPCTPIIPNFSDNIFNLPLIHPDDKSILKSFCSDLQSGKSTLLAELRLLGENNHYIWCNIKGKTIYSDDNIPIRVIGKIINIDSQKKQLEYLRQKSQSDSLTNLYNKATTQELIDRYIATHSQKQNHALMIIDIDDFKAINDTCGHLFGDEVLMQVTTQLKSLFGKEDIVGRIGGDEFVVFMGSIQSMRDIQAKASTISRIFRDTCYKEMQPLSISCSIGISLYPNDGMTYVELLNNADKALYSTKHSGKNSFSVFDSQDNIDYFLARDKMSF